MLSRNVSYPQARHVRKRRKKCRKSYFSFSPFLRIDEMFAEFLITQAQTYIKSLFAIMRREKFIKILSSRGLSYPWRVVDFHPPLLDSNATRSSSWAIWQMKHRVISRKWKHHGTRITVFERDSQLAFTRALCWAFPQIAHLIQIRAFSRKL